MIVFFSCIHIADFVGQCAVLFHLTVRCFQEAVFIDLCICCQVVDQTDVRTFRCFNRTDSTIVRVVNITYFKACSFTCQTTRTKGGDTSFVGKLSQWVFLVHELGQLGRGEELLDCSSQRACICQLLWCQTCHFGNGHSFLDDSFHTGKTDTELVLNQFTNRTDTSVGKHIDVILISDTIQHCQFIVIQCIHVTHCDCMLVIERIDTDQLDTCTVNCLHIDFLNSCTDKPQCNAFFLCSSCCNSFLTCNSQNIQFHIRDVAGNEQFTFFIRDIKIILCCSGDHIQTVAIVQNGVDIVVVYFYRLCIDACVDINCFKFSSNCFYIFFCQNSTHFAVCAIGFTFQIFRKNTADQAAFISLDCYSCNSRMRESVDERQSSHIDTSVDFVTKTVTYFLCYFSTLSGKQSAIGTDQIFSQNIAFHTIQNVQLLSDLVTTCLCQVISSIIEELCVHQVKCTIHSSNFICSLVFIYT